MKRLWWGLLAGMVGILFISPSSSALDTAPTAPYRTTGPFVITGYSFSGPNLRYIQIFNTSNTVASLDGWQVTSTAKATTNVQRSYAMLNGLVAPKKHVIAAVPGIFSKPTFGLVTFDAAVSPFVSTVTLVAPIGTSYLDESVTVPTIAASTQKETIGTVVNYYAKRSPSESTGNTYLSSFSVVFPLTEPLMSDPLYVPPGETGLTVVEIYPDAVTCGPSGPMTGCQDYVKLYNPSSDSINLSDYRLRTGTSGQNATSTNTTALNGTLLPGHYASFPITLSSTGNWTWVEDAYGLKSYQSTVIEYPSSSGHDKQAWSLNDVTGEWQWTIYPTADDQPNRFEVPKAINQCSVLKLSEVAANVATEDQFVEITNTSDQTVSIKGCVLQTNRSTTKQHVFGEEELTPNAHKVVYVKDTELTLTKTTTGTVYLLSSDGLSEVDQTEYENLPENTSWIFNGNTWRYTYQQTPGANNAWLQYLPCEAGSVRNTETGLCNKVTVDTTAADCGEGKYRSVETNRCRTVETSGTTQTSCAADQYRSPETNRCRNLASTTSLLTPCASNQERNPTTNRCRALTSNDENLKACNANQERNPETNRCRNKTSTMKADFPVEAVAQSGQATMGWWAFGGVGTLAAGYAGWEWRREALGWIRKVLPFGIGRS